MLQFDSRWRFGSPGALPGDVVDEVFEQIIRRVASHGDPQDILELFKRRFGQVTGQPDWRSSNESWAASDLQDYMRRASDNAALFLEALYDGLQDVTRLPAATPPWGYVNRVLAPTGYAIDGDHSPPTLRMGTMATPIPVPAHIPSLDEQANAQIQGSLAKSDTFLQMGEHRAAVQEILWLLETVSTAFHGVEYPDGNVTGKYFNRIIGDLQRLNRGKTIQRALEWVENLHGFLSAPAGGGIRHGTMLNRAVEPSASEARLYCDLTRSYISYLLNEHARL